MFAVGARLEHEGEERGLRDAGLEDAASRGGDLHDGLLEPVQQDREVVRREVADDAVAAGTCRGSCARR